MHIEALSAADIEPMVSLLGEMQVSVAGIRSAPLYRRICRDAAAQGGVAAAVARESGDMAGYVIAIVDPRAYWRRIATRAPLLAARIAAGRLFGRLRTPEGRPGGLVAPDLLARIDYGIRPESWADSSPHIAKVVMVGVRPGFQRRGAGAALYRWLFGDLRARGVTRVDACVDARNEASLWLHAASGWELRNSGAGENTVFCVKRL